MSSTDLLKHADGRGSAVLGVICAIIATLFGGLLLWLGYFVGWRNPREYGTNELFAPTTLAIFFTLFVICLGFAILSRRLLSGKRSKAYLLSPFALRAWASFFLIGSFCILVVTLQRGDWSDLPSTLAIASTAISMTSAAFILAKRRVFNKAPKSE